MNNHAYFDLNQDNFRFRPNDDGYCDLDDNLRSQDQEISTDIL